MRNSTASLCSIHRVQFGANVIELIVKVFSGIITKIIGDKWSSTNEHRKAQSKLRSYIRHLSINIDEFTVTAFKLWETSLKYTEFKLYFKDCPKFIIPQDFDCHRIQKHLEVCDDGLNETLYVSVSALIRHIGNYNALKSEIAKLQYDFDENKCYEFYIEALYIRRYIIALANDWSNIQLLTLDNHTHEQLASLLNIPVNINGLRSRVIAELKTRT